YNFKGLRGQLEGLGHQFATRSDTETVVHAYEQYGPDCVKKLRGMFAFALWDERRQTLLLARDRVGKKPLFYTEVEGKWAFASELQALLRHPGLARDVDAAALDYYLLYGYVPTPKTIFRGIYKLPPSHYLTVRLRPCDTRGPEVRLERYWQLAYEP